VWHVAARKNHLTVPGYHWPHVTGRRPELSQRAVDFVGKHEESDEDGHAISKYLLLCPQNYAAYESIYYYDCGRLTIE
jgi:hypothetical protein